MPVEPPGQEIEIPQACATRMRRSGALEWLADPGDWLIMAA
jgi:hypothetical protein